MNKILCNFKDIGILLNYVNFMCRVYDCYFLYIHIIHYLSRYYYMWVWCRNFSTIGIRVSRFKVQDLKRTMSKIYVKLEINKFNDTYFRYWRIQIENYLYWKRLHLPLLGKEAREHGWCLREYVRLASFGIIWLTLSRPIVHSIFKERTMNDLMAVLLDMYEKPLTNNKVCLM